MEIGRWAGYVLFFFLIFLVAVPLTFPTRQLKSFIARQARAQGYPLEIESLAMRGLGGIEVGGVKLTLRGKDGELQENGAMGAGVPEATLHIDRLTARVALLPALFGKTVDVTFDLDAGGGHIEGGHLVKKGDVFDFEIAKIDDLGLGELGLGQRLLSGQKLTGELTGALSGSAKLHWGGSTDDLSGAVDLDLADALLKQPELNLQGGLRLTDLAMGALTLKVKMGLKTTIAALAEQHGAEKATAIHIEQMSAVGDQLDLVTDEASHIMIPPGKGGWKAATIQLHFAFALPDKPSKPRKAKEGEVVKEGEDEAKKDEAKTDGDRAKWSKLIGMFTAQMKPFERSGFIGIGCVGPVARPQCKLELPTMTVGTRGKLDGTAAAPRGEVKPGEPPAAQPVATPEPAVTPPPSPTPPSEFRPVIAATPTPAPTPPQEPERPPEAQVEQRPPEPMPPPAQQPTGQIENPQRGGGDRGAPEGQNPGDAPPERGREGRNRQYDDERPRGSGNRQDPDEPGDEQEAPTEKPEPGND